MESDVRKACGFRTFNALQVASFHQLGRLALGADHLHRVGQRSCVPAGHQRDGLSLTDNRASE